MIDRITEQPFCQTRVRRCLTFIPLWGYNYEWKFNKPSLLKVMYHIYSSVIILSIPIVVFLRWYLNIA
jgi:hypothetical protein